MKLRRVRSIRKPMSCLPYSGSIWWPIKTTWSVSVLGGRFSKHLDIRVKTMNCIDKPGFTVTFSWNTSCESTVNNDFCVKYTAKMESDKMVLKWLTCQNIMTENLEQNLPLNIFFFCRKICETTVSMKEQL